ncbi:MAG: MBL fold metallo-hydrolase [Chloroflexota bacterium]|nr:MBL fold metallo-hydrolase [Chloroflexota bacterium]
MTKPIKVHQNIYMIGDSDLSHSSDCAVYLIDAGDLLLIDSGAGMSFQKLTENIERVGLDPQNLKAVLATHAHIDHIGALHQFKQEFGVEIIAHELDANAIETGIGTGAEFYGVAYKPCAVDTKLQGETTVLEFGKFIINTIHIPGHTPGSIAAYVNIDNHRVLFGQDIHGPYVPQWDGDPEKARQSLQKLIDLKADILCEGHFGIYKPAKLVEKYIRQYLNAL